MALISNHVPTSKRYIAIGIAVCLTYTGVSSSLSFSGVIIDNYGYQYMFYAASSAMVLLLTLDVRIPKDNQGESQELCVLFFSIESPQQRD